MQEEKIVDIKGTLEKFIKADEPDMTQEEAINKFQEKDLLKEIKKSSNNGNNEDSQNSIDQDHLERIKKELLASLDRVKKLEKQIYGENNEVVPKNKLKNKDEQLREQEYLGNIQKEDDNSVQLQDIKEKERE